MCIYSNEARVLCYWGFTPHITALSAGREQFWKSCWLSRQTAASAKASWWYTAPTLMKTCIRNWVFLAGVHSCLCGKWKKCRSCWKLWHPAQKVKQAQEVHFIYYKPYLYFFLQFYCNTTANKHVHPPDTLWKPIAARKLLKKITDVKERGFNFSPTVFLLGSPSPSEVVALLTSCLDRPWPSRLLLLLDPRLIYARKHVGKHQIHQPMAQLVSTYPHGCTGTWRLQLTGIKQEEKWISSLLRAKIKLVIKVHSTVNERVGKFAMSTDRVFLIAMKKDNQSQTMHTPPPAAESQQEHTGRGNQNLITLQVLQDNNRTWQSSGM